MQRDIRVQIFSSFKEENSAEHRRLAEMSPQERLREFAVLQDRRWGRGWGNLAMIRNATWEKVSW